MNGVNKKRRACVTAPSVEPACSLWFIDVKKKKIRTRTLQLLTRTALRNK